MRGLIALWLGSAAGFAVLISLGWGAKGPPDLSTWITILGAFAGVPTLLTMSSKHTQAAREKAALSDPRFAPQLLDVLNNDNFEIQRPARTGWSEFCRGLTLTWHVFLIDDICMRCQDCTSQ